MLVKVKCGFFKCEHNINSHCTRRSMTISMKGVCLNLEEKKEKGENEQSKKRS